MALSRDNGDRGENHHWSTVSTGPRHPDAPSELGTSLQPCDLSADLSSSERDQCHPVAGRQRRRSSLGNVEQSGALQVPLDRDVDGSPVGTRNTLNSRFLSPNTSAVPRCHTPELPQAFISKITNGTMKREEIESAFKDHMHKLLCGGISFARGADQAVPGTPKRYQCDQCSRTVQRHCDLRYVSWTQHLSPRQLIMASESTRSAIHGRMVVPIQRVPNDSEAKTTGKGMKTLVITRSRPGAVKSLLQEARSTNVQRCSIVESYTKPT